MSNILVTGGAGYIGSHTVKELLKKKYRVIVIDNMVYGHKKAVLSDNFYNIDLKNRKKLEGLLKKKSVEAVIHFAAFAYVNESIINPEQYYYNNTVNTLNLLSAMIKSNIKKIVFSSSCSTYGNISASRNKLTEDMEQRPISPYGKSKFFNEQIIIDFSKAYNLRYCILRYFNAAGADIEGILGEDHRPETHLIPTILKSIIQKKTVNIFGNNYPTKDGTCIRDYVHVTDLADAHILALSYMNKQNGCFNLGSEKSYSIKEVIKRCEKITGRKVKAKYTKRRQGDPPVAVASNKKAIKELKWQPKYSNLDTIILTAWKWFLAHPDGYK